MTVPIVTFFNNKGGVGKTALVYHVAWMLADLGHRVVAADLDPQANLTSAFLDEPLLEDLWSPDADHHSVWGALRPFHEGEGPIGPAPLVPTGEDRLALLAGDLALSAFEDDLGGAWAKSMDRDIRAFRTMSAFWSVLTHAATQHQADVVLVDVGPSLGAINRAVLVASDHVVVPIAPDLFSFRGLRNLGPTLRDWRTGWENRLANRPQTGTAAPDGRIHILGYVMLDRGIHLNRPVQAHQVRMSRIPWEFRTAVLGAYDPNTPNVADDPYCLAELKHYHSLMQLGQEARKPIFHLKPADGAFGGHAQAAQRAYQDFKSLASVILDRVTGENPE